MNLAVEAEEMSSGPGTKPWPVWITRMLPKGSITRLARYLRARLLRFPYGLVRVYGEEQKIREGVAEHRAIVIKIVEGIGSLR